MKTRLTYAVITFIVIGLVGFAFKWHTSFKKMIPKGSTLSSGDHVKLHPASPPSLMTLGEWQQYHNARQAALQLDPTLESQYKEILTEMDTQQDKSDAAMLKTDPKLSPILTKLRALRLHNGGAVAAASHSSTAPVSSGTARTLTPSEWQELRTARTQAIQANPGIVAQSKKLQEKMRAFEDKLDATMLKSDPKVAPLIAKFDSARRPPSSPSSK